MARVLGTVLLLGILAAASVAQDAAPMFDPGAVEQGGVRYPYRLLRPPAAEGRWPLVVFLHGAGERGIDNETQLTWLPSVLAEPRNRVRYPCFCLAVQCPEDEQWVDVPWGDKVSTPLPPEPSRALRAVLAAMERVLALEPVDRDRVYLTGLSMGGFGVWDLLARCPERFAAAVPVCGGGDQRVAARMLGVPLWAWHGAEDRAVWPVRSRQMVAAMRGLGGVVRHSELAEVGHHSWQQAYGDDGALGWLFEQDRRAQGREAPAVWPVVPTVAGVVKADGTFKLGSGSAVVTGADLAELGRAVAAELGLPHRQGQPRAGDVAITAERSGPEAFQVTIGDHVTAAGGNADGAAAAAAVCVQLLGVAGRVAGNAAASAAGGAAPSSVGDAAEGAAEGAAGRAAASGVIRRASLLEQPSPSFRGVLIDCARHPISITTLREVVRLCWLLRISHVVLHFTDDQAFTLPSRALPKVPTAGRAYRWDDLRELHAFARARGVHLVPEIDVPGHCAAFVRADPARYGLCGDGAVRNPKLLHPARDRVLDDLDLLLAEVRELFPDAPCVHLGGDEVSLLGVGDDPECKAAMRDHGLASAEELIGWFLGRAVARAEARGFRVLLWEGFRPAAARHVPRSAMVCVWDGSFHPPDRLLAGGFPVVNASFVPLYAVGGSTPHAFHTEALWAWDPRTFRHWDPGHPLHEGLRLPQGAAVAGALFCVWEMPERGVLPALRARLPAFAERSRAGATGPMWEFLTRLGAVAPRLGGR